MRRERAGKDGTANGGSIAAATAAAAAAAAAAATAEQGRQLGGKYDNDEEVGLQSQQSGSRATWEGGSTYVSASVSIVVPIGKILPSITNLQVVLSRSHYFSGEDAIVLT